MTIYDFSAALDNQMFDGAMPYIRTTLALTDFIEEHVAKDCGCFKVAIDRSWRSVKLLLR